ncbi:MAG: amidohydrolase family protein [Bacteroidota bacterium]
MLIIDSHCHAGPGDGFAGPHDTHAPLEKFLQWSLKAGIKKTILFAAFHSDYLKANAYVARIVRSNPGRFYGFAFLHAARDKGRIRSMVKMAVREYGFCGLKIHRYDSPITREICEVARDFHLPVLYDVMGEVTTVDLLANEFPDVNFIIPHLGSFADDWKAQVSFIPVLERYKNIYTDTSGVRRFDMLEKALERAGASKIIFGTDGPWLHPRVELQKILELGLQEEDLSRVLAKNILSLTAKARSRSGVPI